MGPDSDNRKEENCNRKVREMEDPPNHMKPNSNRTPQDPFQQNECEAWVTPEANHQDTDEKSLRSQQQAGMITINPRQMATYDQENK